MEIRLVGRPRIVDAAGQERPVRGHQSWALLARILLTDRPLSRRELSAELFPTAADPLGALRWCLAGLRRALDNPGALTGDPVTAALGPDVVVDLHELRAGRWQGDDPGELLAGVDPRCGPEFETWLMVQRHQVAGLVDAGLRSEVLRLLSAGEAARAVELATAHVQRDVYDEGRHVLLARSLVGAGATRAAAEHVASTTELFRRELGHDPTPALADAARPRLAAAPPGVSRQAVVASLLESGRAALAAGAADPGVEVLRRAAQEAERIEDPPLAATCLLELGTALVHAVRSHDDEGATLLHRSATLAVEAASPETAAAAFRELGYVDALAGRRPSAAEHLGRAAKYADGDPHLLAGVRSVSAFNLGDWGRHHQAIEEYAEARELARSTGQARREAWTLGLGAWVHLAAGDLAGARAWAEASLDLTETTRWVAFRPWPAAVRAEVELVEGAVQATTPAALDEAFALSCSLADPCWEGATARTLALVHQSAGDPDAARRWIDEARRRNERVTDTYVAMRGAILGTSAELAAATGDDARAEQDARALVALAARCHLDGYLPRAVALLDGSSSVDPEPARSARIQG